MWNLSTIILEINIQGENKMAELQFPQSRFSLLEEATQQIKSKRKESKKKVPKERIQLEDVNFALSMCRANSRKLQTYARRVSEYLNYLEFERQEAESIGAKLSYNVPCLDDLFRLELKKEYISGRQD